MVEIEKTSEKKFAKIESEILTPLEIEAGFTILEEYINEDRTPVPEHAFVRFGYIIRKAMDMSTKHNYMIIQLLNLIHKHLLSKGIVDAKDRIFHENRLNMSGSPDPQERDETLPDIAVFEEPFSGDLGSLPHGKVPILVIEILSQSTALIDLTEKKSKFRKLGTKNYWVLKKSENYHEGLEQSYFFKLRGDKYLDLTVEFQESEKLVCEDLNHLEISAQDVWFKGNQNDAIFRWQETEKKADQEKQRADQEKQRADQEKQRADQEKQRADQEKQRADSLQKELNKLKKKTPPN